MNIINLFTKNVETSSEKTAFIFKNQTYSYKEIDLSARKYANYFKSKGISKGDVVLIFIPISPKLYEVILGLFYIGAVAMFIDSSAGINNIITSCKEVKPDVIIGCYKTQLLRVFSPLRKIKKAFTTTPNLPGISYLGESGRVTPFNSEVTVSPEDPALITFTSGSTGIPKAICRTHGFLFFQHMTIAKSLNTKIDTIEINTLPIFILSNLASGISTVIPDCNLRSINKAKPEKIINQIETFNVNQILASPAFCLKITDYLLDTKKELKLLKRVLTGGGPVFPNLLQDLKATMPNAEIIAVYGSTEAEPIAEINFSEITSDDFKSMQAGKGLLVGVPISDIKLSIIPDKEGNSIEPFSRDKFRDFCLPLNTPGEIVVSGNHVLKKYLNTTTEGIKFKVDEEVWHRTGDAGYIDENGKLWLLGRCSAKVLDQEKIIYPFSIEAAAMTNRGVKRAAFIECMGEKVLVIESRNKNIDIVNLKRNINIDRIKVVKKIPVDKRHNSKVLYNDLKKMLHIPI